MLKKFKVLAVLLSVVLIFGLLVAGCGQNEGPQQGTDAGEEKITLRFAHWRGEDNAAFNDIIAQFNAEYPHITVEQDISGSEQYQTKLQAELQAQAGPDVMTVMPGARFANLADADVYIDLANAEFIDRFSPHLLEPGQWKGQQLAIPYQLVFNMPVYNVGMFEEFGLEPPDSWEGFLALCEEIKNRGVTPIIFDSEIGPGQFINPMLMNNMPEGDTLSKVQLGEAKLTDEWFVKTLSQFDELNKRGYFQRDVLGTRKDGAAALFAQEQGAMLAQGSYMMASNRAANPNLRQGLLAPITVPAEEMKYEGIHTATFMLGVNKNSANKEAALKFLEFLFRPEIAAQYAAATGQMLTVNGVEYDSPELNAQTPWLTRNTLFQPRYTVTVSEVETAITTAVVDVIGGMAPADAAQKAQEAVERAIN